MTQDINPYSPPAVEELEAEPEEVTWYVDTDSIHLEDGTVLPKIDLESGSEDLGLVQARRKYMKAHWSLGFMGIPIVLLQFVPQIFPFKEHMPAWTPYALFVGIWLMIYLVIFFALNRRYQFTVYSEAGREARRRRNNIARGILYPVSLALILCPLVYLITGSKDLHLDNTIIPGVIGTFAVSFWQYRDRRKILINLEPDGWLKLTGVHSHALQRLKAWKATHPGHP